MDQKLSRWELAGAVFTLAAGSLLHFVYEWTGRIAVAGAFSPVNESAWEHLKLLFFPLLVFAIAEYCAVGRNVPSFLPAKALGALCGMAMIVVAFYTYTGIVGRNFLWADILTFVLGVLTAWAVSIRLMRRQPEADRRTRLIGALVLLLLLACFVVFTYYPPHIGLFLDPVTGGYGI
jgi:hypothetical protein